MPSAESSRKFDSSALGAWVGVTGSETDCPVRGDGIGGGSGKSSWYVSAAAPDSGLPLALSESNMLEVWAAESCLALRACDSLMHSRYDPCL